MAIIKLTNTKAGKPYGLKAVIDYVINPEKTKDGLLVSGKDCLIESAFKQMMLTKQSFHQLKGRQYVHIIQSFDVDEALTPELAHKIGKELLNSFREYQGVIATHIDRRHIHNHIVLNSVNNTTGRKWQFSKEQHYQLRDYSDQLCKENGLSVLKKGKGWQSYGEHKGDSWKEYLAFHISQSVKKCLTPDEMWHYFNNRGMEVDFRKNDILYTLPDGKKCSNQRLMSYGDYSTENILKQLRFNHLFVKAAYHQPAFLISGLKELARLFPNRSAEDMVDDFAAGCLPKLEGQALLEWILKKKNGATCEYEGWRKQPDYQPNSKLLETVAVTLEAFEQAERKAKPRVPIQIQHQDFRNQNYEDEWEQ